MLKAKTREPNANAVVPIRADGLAAIAISSRFTGLNLSVSGNNIQKRGIMSRKKAFFASFFISMAVVLAIYRGVWTVVQGRSSETDTPQEGVPKISTGVYDRKTLFLQLGDRENPYFFLLKFSAINNRIGICCISSGYEFSDGGTLAESFDRAGIMQCLLDMEEEFGIDIDYYLQCSWQQAAELVKDMTDIGLDSLGENLPPVIKEYLLKGAEKADGQSLISCAEKAAGFLDNEIGLAFLTESMAQLIINNPQQLCRVTALLKENYSSLVTSLNTAALADMDRITALLAQRYVEYPRQVILKGDNRAGEKVSIIME